MQLEKTRISGFTMENIKQLATEGLELVTQERWSRCVGHIQEKVEKHYWTVDGLLDNIIEQMAIEISPNASDSSDSGSETESYNECSL